MERNKSLEDPASSSFSFSKVEGAVLYCKAKHFALPILPVAQCRTWTSDDLLVLKMNIKCSPAPSASETE